MSPDQSVTHVPGLDRVKIAPCGRGSVDGENDDNCLAILIKYNHVPQHQTPEERRTARDA
jgi:hypothetical protein